MLTKDREAEIRARAEAAHKGPWHIHEGDLVDANHQDVFDDWEEAYGPNGDEVGPGTAFICNAQVDMTDTLAALDAERQTTAKLREALNDCEAKASLGAKMVDREHPTIADGFIRELLI